MVVRRLLEMKTIGTYLASGLLLREAPTLRPPLHRARTRWIKGTEEEETHGFAEQMGIGGGVDREISTDVTCVEALGNSQFIEEVQGRLRLISQQRVHPKPRQAPEGNLQGAGPIDSVGIRIALLPVAPLGDQFTQETLFSGKEIDLGQCDEMMMPIQLPYDL